MSLSAHQFPSVHDELGVVLSDLGCIMLDTERVPLPVAKRLEWLGVAPYVSPDPKKFWVDGAVGDASSHVTLLYGLLQPGPAWRDVVDAVLDGWTPEPLTVESVGHFASPYPDESYWCIVAHLKVTPNLLEANARLRFLPHVDTFPDYRPHVTLAYIQSDEQDRDRVVERFNQELGGRQIPVRSELNYGGNR